MPQTPMRIVTINGSLRKNGNKARALSVLEQQLGADAEKWLGGCVEVKSVSLSDLRLEPCRGCRSCFDRGEDTCPCHDDLSIVAEAVREADAVVLASPVYVDDVSGSMKTLIDRLAYMCHRPALSRVTAFALATTGSSPCGHTLHTLSGALLSWGACLVGGAGLKMGALQRAEDVAERHGDVPRRTSRTIMSALARRRSDRPSFVSLMMFAIQQSAWGRVSHDRLDYRYWKGEGFLERGRTFFHAHHANPVKVAAARVTGRTLAAIFRG